MLVQNLLQPFEIECIQANNCPIKPHHHTFIELVYIRSGEGLYHINQNRFAYRTESLFLLLPGDTHYTEVRTSTSFLFVRFNAIYLNAQRVKDQHGSLGNWVQKLDYIFQHGPPSQGSLINNGSDRSLVSAIAEAIANEATQRQLYHQELTQQLVNTLLTVVARNISLRVASKTSVTANPPLDILQYIHRHIYQPEKLKAEAIATHFRLSLHYVSEYFKKHTGHNLQQYIIGYKLSLAETRLLQSDLRLKEIAYELGFTDESHLTKTFKKHRGVTPSQYRKRRREAAW